MVIITENRKKSTRLGAFLLWIGEIYRGALCQHSATMFRRQRYLVHRVFRGALPRFFGALGPVGPEPVFLLYRQRHVLFLTGQKENVGLKRWVLEITTLWLTEDMKTYAPDPTYGMRFLRIHLTIGPGCCALDPRNFRPRESHQSAPGAPEGSAGSPRTPGLRQ